ncbi:O-antigen ligase family protein [Virgibacillus dokdonensis]|uniref:O-antigen ligase family protein n=1 Tax=Virgibacillus dokdonensis TaxID=302167 RepID=UPI000989FA1D|nr:O-antigen ligase family protein [Virgibacillus dokdonensis]
MNIKINKILLVLLFSIIMVISNLMTIYYIDPDKITNKWIILLAACVVIYLFSFNKYLWNIFNPSRLKLHLKKIIFIFTWELFICFIFYSKYTLNEFNMFEFLVYAVFVPIIFFTSNIYQYKFSVILSFIISLTPFLYLIRPNNPNNNLGIILCIAGILLLSLLRAKKINNKYIYISMLVFFLFLFLTQSRTAILSFFVVSTFYFFNDIMKSNTSYIIIVKKIIALITILFGILLSYSFVMKMLIYKWGGSQDISSGRFEFWGSIINNGVTWFGKGENYFLDYNLRDAHNIFIQVLSAYGFISFVFFVAISIYIFTKSIKLKNLEYISFFIGFYLLGQFENLFFIDSRLMGIHIVYFVYLGCLMNERKLIKNFQ